MATDELAVKRTRSDSTTTPPAAHHPMQLARDARARWLAAATDAQLEEARALYGAWWPTQFTWTSSCDGTHPDAPLTIRTADGGESIDPCELQLHQEKAILLSCQLGHDAEAGAMMKQLGLVVRLSREVLRYGDGGGEAGGSVAAAPTSEDSGKPRPSAAALAAFGVVPAKGGAKAAAPQAIDFPGRITDNVLCPDVLKTLKGAFLPRTAAYWTEHAYSDEPPSPFFSYLIPLGDAAANPQKYGALGILARTVFEIAATNFAQARGAKVVEMWAHNRAHATGHQMHVDSDAEGFDGIRNPTLGSVFYLSNERCGGPTLITAQSLADTKLTPHGWFVMPRENRLVLFDGKKFHGVVPGRGIGGGSGPGGSGGKGDDESRDDVAATRRVTVMCALWHDIKTRVSAQPGAARPFPDRPPAADTSATQWVREVAAMPEALSSSPVSFDVPKWVKEHCVVAAPSKLKVLWETPDCAPWPCASAPIPPYDSVFQGF